MANNNNKSRRNVLKREKAAVTFQVPKTVPGGKGYTLRSLTLPFGAQPRKSKRAKVGAPGKGGG